MRIAIIGSGISGLASAYLLAPQHEITLYEKEDRPGGHARTREVTVGDRTIAVDTGFIVFNDRNYPNLLGLFAALGVESHASNMSFAASVANGAFEYSSKSLRGVFPTLASLFDGRRYAMGRDYFRFSRYAKAFLKNPDGRTLGELVRASGVGEHFAQYFILPIGGAIWSCPVATMMDYPARTFVQFFENHGLLDINGQPLWRTVTGGSRQYVQKLLAAVQPQVKLAHAAVEITRTEAGVRVRDAQGGEAVYDHVVMAAHADASLAMLTNPSPREREVLGAFRFQPNRMVLHGDTSFMPREERCWASWVYLTEQVRDEAPQLAVSYWMNLLQDLPREHPLIVTLNPPREPAAALIYDQHDFDHPIFDEPAIQAQAQLPSINGVDRISYVGAWQRYGFHEDGIWSAVRAAKGLGAVIPWERA